LQLQKEVKKWEKKERERDLVRISEQEQ